MADELELPFRQVSGVEQPLEPPLPSAGDSQVVATEDDLVRFHALVAGGNQSSTTTDRLQTRANTGSRLANARETTRENGEQRGVDGGKNAGAGGMALARPYPESAPTLALRADTKKPGASPGFRIWWPSAELNHGHADFQSAALPTELLGQRGAKYSESLPGRQKKESVPHLTRCNLARPVGGVGGSGWSPGSGALLVSPGVSLLSGSNAIPAPFSRA